ncbi:MAG: lipopolysaccharide heptosyltransferase II [Candidatus Omnitrophica bacterium]|nr:lipopolysaccharide heptosyltransferase II [Candidatus Omnitrophota bacterium]
MHVLQLLPSLEVGGVERGVLDLTRGLLACGHRVSVVSSGGPLVERLTQLGARHYRLPVHEKSLAAIGSCIPAVVQLIRSTGVDLVHARSRVPGWIGFAAARWTQRPFVTTAHGFYRPHLASRVMVWGRLVIVPSEALGRYLVEQFRAPKDRIRVIPRGVDVDEFAFHPPSPNHEGPWRIGLIGRLSPLKGQAVALRACARLRRHGVPVTLCLVGDRPDAPARRALDSLIAHERLQEAVEWLGIRHDIPAVIASMDLLIVPSTYPESFGRSVIEAQAVGRPVVASRVGALAELIEDGRSGLLVPPRDPQALAEAIGRFINDPALRQRCVEAGRQRVEAEWTAARMVERTLAVYDECLHRPRVLIWKLSALGDVILSTPSLRAIRRRFPRGHLTLVVGRSAYEVVARCPYLNDIQIFDPKRKDHGVVRHAAFIRRLRQGRFDLSVDLQNSRKTHLMAWWAGIPVRIGYRRKLGWLLNRGVRLPRVVLAPIAHQHYLLKQAGIMPDGEALELWPSARDDERARQLLEPLARQGTTQLVGVHPGGSGRWKTKRWELKRWASVCDALTQRGIRVVVTGGPEERPLGEALSKLTKTRPLVVIGQTSLLELACLIRRCDAFLAHDSSSLHLAAVVGTPTVALFGPTDPKRHLPPTFTGTVIKKDVACSPCYATRCRTITHACMKRISAVEVLSAVLGWLADSESSAHASSPAAGGPPSTTVIPPRASSSTR